MLRPSLKSKNAQEAVDYMEEIRRERMAELAQHPIYLTDEDRKQLQYPPPTKPEYTVADETNSTTNTEKDSSVQDAAQASKVLNILKIVLTVLAGLAATVAAMAASGTAIPPVILTIASIVTSIAAALGIASSGLPKSAKAPETPKE